MKHDRLLIITSLLSVLLLTLRVTHDMYGAKYAEHAASSSGFFFVWTLFALGITGVFTMILSAQGLWSLRRGKAAGSAT